MGNSGLRYSYGLTGLISTACCRVVRAVDVRIRQLLSSSLVVLQSPVGLRPGEVGRMNSSTMAIDYRSVFVTGGRRFIRRRHVWFFGGFAKPMPYMDRAGGGRCEI